MANKKGPIQILVKDRPPVKTAVYDRNNLQRRKKLLEETTRVAKETKRAFELYGKRVKMTISYRRSEGKHDAANIVGGIADAMQGPYYQDDNQIAEIHYIEQPVKKVKKKDEYEVILEDANQQ